MAKSPLGLVTVSFCNEDKALPCEKIFFYATLNT